MTVWNKLVAVNLNEGYFDHKAQKYIYPETPNRYTLSRLRPSIKPPLNMWDEIEASFHFSGSDKKFYAGAESWPVVDMQVSFEEGDVAGRDKFVIALQQFVTTYFNSKETDTKKNNT